jgi:hypothetical protein
MTTTTVKGLFIGVDYTGNSIGISELRGCVNDARTLHAYVRDTFGLQNDDLKMLLNQQATKSAILQELDVLRANSANSLVFVFYSGHGTYYTDFDGDEADGHDEIIVPFDGNLITDDEFYAHFTSKLDPSCHLVLIVDACNSGTFSDCANNYVLTGSNVTASTLSSKSFPCKVFGLSACSDDELARESFFSKYNAFRGHFTVALQELWTAQNLAQMSFKTILQNLNLGPSQTINVTSTEILHETTSTLNSIFGSIQFQRVLSDPSTWLSLPVSASTASTASTAATAATAAGTAASRKRRKGGGSFLTLAMVVAVFSILFMRRN